MKYLAITSGLFKERNPVLSEVISFVVGVCLLVLSAQISIPVPWSPVPITGQTFGVAVIALSWGSVRGGAIFFTYLMLGIMGMPVFYLGGGSFSWGPTVGYLVGMQIASVVVGYLADIGFTKTFLNALFAAYCGSFIVFACGLTVLSFFAPKGSLLMMGLFPFLIGDLIKNMLAAYISKQ